MILVIGDLRHWRAAGRILAEGGDVRYAAPEAVDRALIDEVAPDLVLAPLAGQAFDALDLARRLSAAGYRGPFRVVTLPVPDPEVIREEVAEAAPGLDFDLVVIDARLN